MSEHSLSWTWAFQRLLSKDPELIKHIADQADDALASDDEEIENVINYHRRSAHITLKWYLIHSSFLICAGFYVLVGATVIYMTIKSPGVMLYKQFFVFFTRRRRPKSQFNRFVSYKYDSWRPVRSEYLRQVDKSIIQDPTCEVPDMILAK